MREGFDKEIDSLLRRTAPAPARARGNGASTSKPDTHLDADELAAFAEGALPEAARMNAVSHLADCGECRSLAVNLTRAAGVETRLEKQALAAAAASPAREPVVRRGWLAAIFAPRTLRYVAPALVVCLVAAVSFIALRSRGGLDRAAALRDEKNTGARPSAVTTQNDSQPSTEGALNSNASSNANTAATAPGVLEPALKEKSETEARPVPEARSKDAEADAPDGSTPGAPAESKATGEVAASQPPPPPAKEDDSAGAAGAPPESMKSARVAEVPAPKPSDNMKAGPPPAPVQTDDELARNEVSQKRAAQQRGLEPQAPDGGARQRSAANNAPSGGLASTTRDDRDARSRRGEGAARRSGRGDQVAVDGADREREAPDARSVAGHRFRREGGAWVDVNYKSSMSSTGVRRGTDAYRALVADIPELGRVAEQLGGEVIVVVRGRAYHIR